MIIFLVYLLSFIKDDLLVDDGEEDLPQGENDGRKDVDIENKK